MRFLARRAASSPFNELLIGMLRSALVPRFASDVVIPDIGLGERVQSELHVIWENNDKPAFAMLMEAIRRAVREGWGS